MKAPKFEDVLDDWLRSSATEPDRRVQLDDLPADLRAMANASERNRRLLADWLWLHQQVSGMARPMPSANFVDRVVAALTESAPSERIGGTVATTDWPTSESAKRARNDRQGARRNRFGSAVRMRAWGAVAAAACLVLLLAVRGRRFDAPIEGDWARPTVAMTRDPFADATVASVELARQFADGMRFSTTIDFGDPDAGSDASAEGFPIALLPLPMSEAVRASTDSLVTGGQGIGSRLRPITDSAAGAFGFLLGDLGKDQEPPSI